VTSATLLDFILSDVFTLQAHNTINTFFRIGFCKMSVGLMWSGRLLAEAKSKDSDWGLKLTLALGLG
jgi:hypothetical protein